MEVESGVVRTIGPDVGRQATAGVVFLLIAAISVPADIFSVAMPGHRQYLVPAMSLLTGLVWLILWRARLPAIRGRVGIAWAACAVFIGLNVVAALVHPRPFDSLALVGTYAARAGMAFVLVQLLVEEPALLLLATRWLWMLLTVIALLLITGVLLHAGGYLRATEAAGLHIERASAGFGDPNFTALVFNAGLAMALGWLAIGPTIARRVTAGAASLVLVIAIGRTVSLGGLIGLMVTLGLTGWWVALRAPARRRQALLALTGGLVLAIVAAGGGAYLARIQQQTVRSSRSLGAFGTERLNLAIGGSRMAAMHSIAGVGQANVSRRMPVYLPYPISDPEQGPHNTILAVADESGVPALLLLLFATGVIAMVMSSALRRARSTGLRSWQLLGWALATAAVAALVQSFALSTQRQTFLWLIGSLVAAWSVTTLRVNHERSRAGNS